MQEKKLDKKTQSKFIIISGPSGVGKNSVIHGILKKLKNAIQMITYTTRKPRLGEKHGKDYFFLTKKEFEKKIKQNEFLEWAKVHKIHYYGNSKKDLENLQKKYKTVIITIDVQGAETIRKKNIPHLSIFINAESKQKLISRIKKRNTKISPEKLARRIKSATTEIKSAKKYDYQIINYENKLNETVDKVYKIIKNLPVKTKKCK